MLKALKKERAVLDESRMEECIVLAEAGAELEAGITGVRKALGLLRKYYGTEASSSDEVQLLAGTTPTPTIGLSGITPTPTSDLSSLDNEDLNDEIGEVLVRYNKQAPVIAGGLYVGAEDLDVEAGDQEIEVLDATDEEIASWTYFEKVVSSLRHPECVNDFRGFILDADLFPSVENIAPWWVPPKSMPDRSKSMSQIRDAHSACSILFDNDDILCGPLTSSVFKPVLDALTHKSWRDHIESAIQKILSDFARMTHQDPLWVRDQIVYELHDLEMDV